MAFPGFAVEVATAGVQAAAVVDFIGDGARRDGVGRAGAAQNEHQQRGGGKQFDHGHPPRGLSRTFDISSTVRTRRGVSGVPT